jgi:Leucine-rich repeat (LRR) protein
LILILGLNECTKLNWLNVGNNELKEIDLLSPCIELKLLNISHNFITNIDAITHMKQLRGLIANNNEIIKLPNNIPKNITTIGKQKK